MTQRRTRRKRGEVAATGTDNSFGEDGFAADPLSSENRSDNLRNDGLRGDGLRSDSHRSGSRVGSRGRSGENFRDAFRDSSKDEESKGQRSANRFSKSRATKGWDELRDTASAARPSLNTLASLIDQDAPLQTHSGLVLMYGPFQVEMQSAEGLGVASWIRECVRKHGLPSLVRYDFRHRAQVYRRDQFQPWLEPLMTKLSSQICS